MVIHRRAPGLRVTTPLKYVLQSVCAESAKADTGESSGGRQNDDRHSLQTPYLNLSVLPGLAVFKTFPFIHASRLSGIVPATLLVAALLIRTLHGRSIFRHLGKPATRKILIISIDTEPLNHSYCPFPFSRHENNSRQIERRPTAMVYH
jgi:hypothetical protein